MLDKDQLIENLVLTDVYTVFGKEDKHDYNWKYEILK